MCSVMIRTRDNRVSGAHVSSGLWGLPSIYSVCYYFILHASLLGTGTLNARTVAGKLLLNYHRSTLIVPNNLRQLILVWEECNSSNLASDALHQKKIKMGDKIGISIDLYCCSLARDRRRLSGWIKINNWGRQKNR